MSTTVQAEEITGRVCPPCRDGKSKPRDIYQYARAYLCESCVEIWDAADAAEHGRARREKSEHRCPWAPLECRRCA